MAPARTPWVPTPARAKQATRATASRAPTAMNVRDSAAATPAKPILLVSTLSGLMHATATQGSSSTETAALTSTSAQRGQTTAIRPPRFARTPLAATVASV